MNYILCLGIVMLCGANVCRSANVNITIEVMKKDNSSVKVTLTPGIITSIETLSNVTVTKDKQPFYSYKLGGQPVFNRTYGVESINTRGYDKNTFEINRLNRTSAGVYTLTVFYTSKGKLISNSSNTKLIVSETPLPTPKLRSAMIKFSTDKVTKGKDVNLNCSFTLQKGSDSLNSVRLYKDNGLFYSTDYEEYKPIRGVEKYKQPDLKLFDGTKLTGALTTTIQNVTKDTAGKYKCEVEFYNGTRWLMQVESSLSNAYQHLLSYVLAIMCSIGFAINH